MAAVSAMQKLSSYRRALYDRLDEARIYLLSHEFGSQRDLVLLVHAIPLNLDGRREAYLAVIHAKRGVHRVLLHHMLDQLHRSLLHLFHNPPNMEQMSVQSFRVRL